MATLAEPMATVGRHDLNDGLRLIKDLYAPRPCIYWSDLVLSAGVGWAAFAACLALPFAWPMLGATVVAVLALYRASLFIHELAHLRAGEVPGFRAAWNVLVGYPLLIPSALYESMHADHHRSTTFGTAADPEYLPLRGRRRAILVSCLLSLAPPVLLGLRFLVVGPLGLVCPPLQRWLEARGSALSLNPRYRRAVGRAEHRRLLGAQGGILCLWGSAFAAAALGSLPWKVFGVWYVVFTGICVVNQVRGLGVHRYQSEGAPVDHAGQLLDSINTPGGPWTELWAPLGMRYHALHHLLPAVPYHNLGVAYRRLRQALPADSIYHGSTSPSLWRSLRGLWLGDDGTGDAPRPGP
jgi:fatty acid desaturase